MANCTGCGISITTTKAKKRSSTTKKTTLQPLIVEKSAEPEKKVLLKYYGGGISINPTAGCGSCHGGGNYAVKTSERITFASDDAPDGIFDMQADFGKVYPVTQNQAKYLLSLTFINKAGQEAHKFKEVT